MATLIFHSNYVGDDELSEIRALLVDNNMEFHETGAGLLGLGKAGLWVESTAAEQARQLIDDYQQLRQKRIQQLYQQHPVNLWQLFRKQPVKWLLNMLIIISVLGLSLLPFYFFL